MSKLLSIFAVLALTFSVHAQIASDNGSNYSGGWTNDSNGGFGFGAWTINNNNNGSSIFAGNFIGNPADAGISGMSTEAFGLYANPAGSGAFVNAFRPLNTALQVGETFSFQWGINWDGGNGSFGNKGFNLNVGVTQVVNVNNGGNSDIQFNSSNTGMGFGTAVMTWSFTYSDATTLSISATDRDGVGTFATNITVAGGISSFELYASDMAGDTQRQPYYNNFQVVPEPTTVTLALLGLAGLTLARRRKQ